MQNGISWYNLGGMLRGYMDGGHVKRKGYASGGIVDWAPEHGADFGAGPTTAVTSVAEAPTVSDFSVGTGPQRNTEAEAAATPFQVNPGNNWEVPGVAEHIAANSPVPVLEAPAVSSLYGDEAAAALAAGPGGVSGGWGNVATPNPHTLDVVNDGWANVGATGEAPTGVFDNLEEAVLTGEQLPGQGWVDTSTGPTGNWHEEAIESNVAQIPPIQQPPQPDPNSIGSYFTAPAAGQPGVQTGIPQGGHAKNAIAQYFAGPQSPIAGGPGAAGGLSYQQNAHGDQQTQWIDQAQGVQDQLAADSSFIQQANALSTDDNPVVDVNAHTGEITFADGNTTIGYDSAHEYQNAQNIQEIVEEGGINPETGDYNIAAGPNVLGAADEGFFGFGEDYNQEFQENYDYQSDHSDANPTGMSTGTPLYDQGYVEPGGIADTIINNSTIGLIGNALTGENLVQTYDDLLPPAAAFENSSSDDNDNDNSWQNDGDPTNDQGNSGWGFDSFADMFDGGGPGASGDSYSGGIHGDDTVGDTSEGVGSIVSDWFGGGSSDDGGGSSDSGSSSDDGTWCCTAAYKEGMPIRKIKELRKWHRSMPTFWQEGYDIYGNWIANNLVKGSPFWSRVTEAGHTAFVERRITPMSSLAVLVIAPGSIVVGLYKQLTRRKADARVK